MDYENMTPGEVLAEASVAEFIKTLALGIADAQRKLDENSIEQLFKLADTKLDGSEHSLLELGLTPPFYHFQYADIEVSMHLKLAVETSFEIGAEVSGSYDDSSSANTSNSDTTQTQTEATPAMAVLKLARPLADPVTITVGGTSVSEGTANLGIHAIARVLSNKLSTGVLELSRATWSVFDASSVLPTTDCPTTFVCTSNSVVVNDLVARRRAWISITQTVATQITLLGTDTCSWPATGSLAAAVVNAQMIIELDPRYTAKVLINGGMATALPHFEYNQFAIRTVDYPALDALADWLLLPSNMSVNFEIKGHTDLSGGYPYNMVLSNRRALEVRDYLVARGVASTRMTTTPCGPNNPVNGNTGPDFDNRRVEIVFSSIDNVIEIENPSSASSWGSGPSFSPGSAGTVNAIDNGSTPNIDQKYVEVSGTKFYVGSVPVGATGQFFAQAPTAAETAQNLAGAIASALPTTYAWAVGRQVHLESEATYALITIETKAKGKAANDTALTGLSTGLTIEKAFAGGTDATTHTIGSTSATEKNRAVALAASVDVRYSKQFALEIEGNSRIATRLVAIPAPPALLAEVKKYLTE